MIGTKAFNENVITFLSNLGIECSINMDVVAVNRTSMCCASICNNLDENDSYSMILLLIKEEFMQEGLYICWGGKTDDDYFLTIYIKETN